MKHLVRDKRCCASLILAGLVAICPAMTAMGQGLEEIVVTSRKLGAESAQELPATISAFGEDFLKENQVTDFENFARFVPGLTFDDLSPGERRYTLRGVRSPGQQQVGVYYDDVPLPGVQDSASDSGSQTPDLKLYDMERIEVLRGPQGTTFGANSQSGTVRYITKKPVQQEFDAYVGGQFSRTDHADGNNWNIYSVVNIPLTDQLAARALVYSGEDAGYLTNNRCRPIDPTQPIGDDPGTPNVVENNIACLNIDGLNSVETTGFRGALQWEPSEDFTLDTLFWWQERDPNGDNRYHPFDTFEVRPGQDNGDLDAFSDRRKELHFCETGKWQVCDYAQTFKPDEQIILSATAEWKTPWGFNVTAAPSYYDRDFDFKFDSTWIITLLYDSIDPTLFDTRPDLIFALTNQSQSLEQEAFELRFTSNDPDAALKWVGGFFWRNRESEFQSFVPVINLDGLEFDPGVPFTIPPTNDVGAGIPGCHPCVFARTADKDIEEIAVFGDVTWEFLENFEISAGARWFESDFEEVGETVFEFAAFGGNPPTDRPDMITIDDSETPWRISLGWSPTDDITTYILRSNGFRLGGTNNQGIIAVPPLYEADELTNYEWGLKTQWLDQRLTWNTAVFLQEFENIQVSGDEPTGAFSFVGNAGTADLNGLETEVFWSPTDNLALTAQITYLWEKELSEDQVSDTIVSPGQKGDELPRVPEMTAAWSAQYSYQLYVPEWDGFVRIDGSFTDDSETELRPDSPDNRFQDSYTIWNARFGFRNESHDLDLIFFIENFTDEDGDVFIGTNAELPTFKITNRPRTWGVEIVKGFGRN
jgi:outer membrane receptor protein involved in Fe transport